MLDPLHIVLMAAVGLVSLLFSIVAWFISRDFKSRDARDKEFMHALSAIQKDLTLHEGRIAATEAQIADNVTRLEGVARNAHDALNLANVLSGRLAGGSR